MRARQIEAIVDPLELFRAAEGLEGLAFLHSGTHGQAGGRYSILAAEPWRRLRYRDGRAQVEEDGQIRSRIQPLRQVLQECFSGTAPPADCPAPFRGGAIGYLAYEAGCRFEPGSLGDPPRGHDEAVFAFYRGALVFDHQEGRSYAAGIDEVGLREAENLLDRLRVRKAPQSEPFRLEGDLGSNFSREDFVAAVRRIRDYIREGEVYQVNLAQRMKGDCRGSSVDLFCRLARLSPAPYAAYLDLGDEQIISSSPELFLRKQGSRVSTRPIKGTRPSGGSTTESERFSRELALSEKERAELLMIVDLERNDLGRVCRTGSVEVCDLYAQERYATVIHQVAQVSGELATGMTVTDCLAAMFPGGSITGAPKIRSMQVIAEIEKEPRGVYTGAIGYCDVSGDAVFNIAIRTIRIADHEVSFHVGSGIVWDSDPQSEYEETLLKAKAMREAIEGARG